MSTSILASFTREGGESASDELFYRGSDGALYALIHIMASDAVREALNLVMTALTHHRTPGRPMLEPDRRVAREAVRQKLRTAFDMPSVLMFADSSSIYEPAPAPQNPNDIDFNRQSHDRFDHVINSNALG
jgi:hypothetical protein